MKRYMALFLTVIVIGTVIAGCGQSDSGQENETSVAETQAEDTAAAQSDGISEADDSSAESTGVSGDSSVVDLTQLGSVMVYSEVYNMMMNPEDYMNKTIIINGAFFTQYSTETEQYYYFVINEDAAACCQQGLEFILKGDYDYPNDYPEAGTEIQVSGVFKSYEELGKTYYYIDADEMIV